ncbi:YggT family protein [Cellulomonas endophytica]|uniref:YggT family protein n=1 Tax=Cellulomonas endophytica TaxID=2494735 RepID=UPI0010124EDA|nr:YggT family protein [Cellulomonas endophytica]
MGFVTGLLYLVVLVFFLLLLVRLVLDWVQVFARSWRPTGVVLVVAELTYSVTDPPLRALRRVLPPIGIGAVRIDLAFMVLFFLCVVLMGLLG